MSPDPSPAGHSVSCILPASRGPAHGLGSDPLVSGHSNHVSWTVEGSDPLYLHLFFSPLVSTPLLSLLPLFTPSYCLPFEKIKLLSRSGCVHLFHAQRNSSFEAVLPVMHTERKCPTELQQPGWRVWLCPLGMRQTPSFLPVNRACGISCKGSREEQWGNTHRACS